jgi:prepilin-type N-terminal cleavage/methylation domain-containing protein
MIKISPKTRAEQRGQQRGFSLIEMLIVITVMFIVFAVVFRSADMFQQRGAAETEKVDSVQEARDFMDTVNRDIHDAGFPPLYVNPSNNNSTNTGAPAANICAGAPTLACSCVGNPNIACGIIYYTPTKVQYEGDLDGTGTVYVVTLQISPNASGDCPCILQRGVVTKTQYLANVAPTYYTEVNGLLNSGNWAGAATYPVVATGGLGNYTSYGPVDVFDGYYNDATQVTTTCTSPAACVGSATPIRELQVTANVIPNFSDSQTKVFPVFSVTTKARLSNVSP